MATTYSAHSNVEFFFYGGEILQLENLKKPNKNVVSREIFAIFRNKIIKLITSTPRDFLGVATCSSTFEKMPRATYDTHHLR
jgi:hypothetical protein